MTANGAGVDGPAGGGVDAAVVEAFRADWGRVVANLIAITGDWDLAEESAQEAFAQALAAWRRDGVPDRPRAWLTTTARNRAIDRIRRDRVGAAKLRLLADAPPPDVTDDDPVAAGLDDERLRLIFTCCHPALAIEARVALALRTLCGLSVAEVARAFLVTEAAMAKRLVRIKSKIRIAAIPYRVPPAHRLAERTPAVLGVIYLLFNEGYAATAGPDLVRPDVCAQAVDLARLMCAAVPDDPETLGLYALLQLTHARTPARLGPAGLVPLDEQDRSLWDRSRVEAGLAAVRAALRRERPGPYQLQAVIAAVHATAPGAADTDWARIVRLYDQLSATAPSITVTLNRAVAVAMRDGPAAGLALVAPLDEAEHPMVAAVRADLLRRSGDRSGAAAAYGRAIARATNDTERAYLARRRSECDG